MVKYDDFILEQKIYNLMLESKIQFSSGFISAISSISNPLAKEILALNGTESDDVKQNYVDVDLSSNDKVTFIQDKKAKQLVKGSEEIFILSDTSKHLKSKDFETKRGEEKNREIYNLLGVDIDKVNKASNGKEIKITKELASPFDADKIYCAYKSTEGDFIGVINKVGITQNDAFKKLWSVSSRSTIRIGRMVAALLPLIKKKFTDAQVEKFVNEYKGVMEVLNNAFSKFDIVSGDDIYNFYQASNYSIKRGQLSNSCMAGAKPSWLYIYTANPDVVQMVILYDDSGSIVDGKYKSEKIKGRALLWKTDNGYSLMDRIYTISDSDIGLFEKFATRNGWWSKSGYSESIVMMKKGEEKKQEVVIVSLKKWEKNYPYLDTLCYFNSKTGKLSSDSGAIKSDWSLGNTDGSYYDGDMNDQDDDYYNDDDDDH